MIPRRRLIASPSVEITTTSCTVPPWHFQKSIALCQYSRTVPLRTTTPGRVTVIPLTAPIAIALLAPGTPIIANPFRSSVTFPAWISIPCSPGRPSTFPVR